MKILITGSTGFIGRNLLEYLRERHSAVHAPKRAELDLTEARPVREYLERHQFDVVIHAAVTTTSVEQNLKMYFNLENGSATYGRMLSIGSGAEFDMQHYLPRMKEEYFGTYVPSDIYGFSKYVIARDIEARPRNIINLRLFGIFGKYENYRRRFISNNICRALCDLDLSISRNMALDYLYIKDFLRIIDLFLTRDCRYRSYNICTGRGTELLTLATLIQAHEGKNRRLVIHQEGMNPEYSGDNTRFLAEFGPFAFTDYRTAIAELFAWYRDSGEVKLDPKEFQP